MKTKTDIFSNNNLPIHGKSSIADTNYNKNEKDSNNNNKNNLNAIPEIVNLNKEQNKKKLNHRRSITFTNDDMVKIKDFKDNEF